MKNIYDRDLYARTAKALSKRLHTSSNGKVKLQGTFGGWFPRDAGIGVAPAGNLDHVDPITQHLLPRISTAKRPVRTELEFLMFLHDHPVGLPDELLSDEAMAALTPLILAATDRAHRTKVSEATFSQWCVWGVIEAMRVREFKSIIRLKAVTDPGNLEILELLLQAGFRTHDRGLCPGIYMEVAVLAWLDWPYR